MQNNNQGIQFDPNLALSLMGEDRYTVAVLKKTIASMDQDLKQKDSTIAGLQKKISELEALVGQEAEEKK